MYQLGHAVPVNSACTRTCSYRKKHTCPLCKRILHALCGIFDENLDAYLCYECLDSTTKIRNPKKNVSLLVPNESTSQLLVPIGRFLPLVPNDMTLPLVSKYSVTTSTTIDPNPRTKITTITQALSISKKTLHHFKKKALQPLNHLWQKLIVLLPNQVPFQLK